MEKSGEISRDSWNAFANIYSGKAGKVCWLVGGGFGGKETREKYG